ADMFSPCAGLNSLYTLHSFTTPATEACFAGFAAHPGLENVRTAGATRRGGGAGLTREGLLLVVLGVLPDAGHAVVFEAGDRPRLAHRQSGARAGQDHEVLQRVVDRV